MITKSNKHKKEKGVGFVELAIIIPVILFLILGAIELGRALRVHSAMNVLARGLASSAFRDCSNKTLSASLQNCLNGVISSTTTTANTLLPGATLIVSLYKWDATKPPGSEPTLVGIAPINQTNPASKFNTSYFSTAQIERNRMLENNGVIVFGEVFFPYSSLVPIAPLIFALSTDRFYVAAAY